MPSSSLPPAPPAHDTAVLLVLLPLADSAALPGSAASVFSSLQAHLEPAIRVMCISEASHPAVVRSFHAPQLPALVLVRQGVELWRQQGLAEVVSLAPLLHSKLVESGRTPTASDRLSSERASG